MGLRNILIGGLIAGAVLGDGGCTPAYIPERTAIFLREEVKKKPLFVAIEGLGIRHEIGDLVKIVTAGGDIAGVATSGNWGAHLDLIRRADANGQEKHISGHSSGAYEAVLLAEQCIKEGIEIDGLYLLDPTVTARFKIKIPRVRYVANIRSDADDFVGGVRILGREYLEDSSYTLLENVGVRGSHLGLPLNSAHLIRTRIRQ
ncbi:hypothetical protein CMI37_10535 [Candidatus Pacearchaeota archaeon]|nr:hypothetical protein [Candidatus Pacearchaeota archaeon]|tara:strand:+ start:1612 stop:2220 length:609 start_codon:yes stop_codon:yes gene_type:complete